MTSAEGSPVVAPRPGSSFRVVMFGALCLVSSLFLARQHSTLVALAPSLGGFYEAGVTDLAASPPPGDEDEKDEDETRLLNIQQPDAGGDREVEAEVGPGGSPGPERSPDGSPDAPPRAAAHRETADPTQAPTQAPTGPSPTDAPTVPLLPEWQREFVWPEEFLDQTPTNGHTERWAAARGAQEEKLAMPVVEQKPYDPERRMNILLLYADDWRYDTLGVAGNPIVKTPTIDRLAGEGVRFTHSCVTTSVCWVSRASMVSSLYLTRHKTYRPREFYVPWNETVYDLLQTAGYHTGHIGKWGFNHAYKNRPDFEVEEDGWHMQARGGKMWHVTEKNEADALRFLEERPRDKPFFANVAFFATHAVDGDKRQYLPQNRSMSMYVDDVIPDPQQNNPGSYERLPPFFDNYNEGRTRWRWRYETGEKHQHMMKDYYRMASEVDSACDLILKELYLQGELDRTLIIWTTDNGNFHSEHGLADKWYPHEESIRVPLIIKDPRMPKDMVGTLNDDFTLNIDLAPTMLAAAGVEAPKTMMGRDMAQLYLGEDRAQTPAVAKGRYLEDSSKWRTEFFYEHPIISHKKYIPSSEALVRKDYKYFFWPDYKFEQLFDLAADPREENDLLRDESKITPDVRKILDEMRGRFNEIKSVVHDEKRHVIL